MAFWSFWLPSSKKLNIFITSCIVLSTVCCLLKINSYSPSSSYRQAQSEIQHPAAASELLVSLHFSLPTMSRKLTSTCSYCIFNIN